ncbi:MAG: tetratricopeptide repeat protein [Betaproteobacteria bacterium]|nr:MAG: tetratricopeptide repeat protein [Betaproteobacteria bacterium]
MVEGGALGAQRARQRLAAGDVDGARHEAQAVVAGAGTPAERGAAHLVLAACFEKRGDLATALAHARDAVVCAPHDPVAHYAHAELQEATGDKPGAIASLRLALELEPRFAQALRYLGILLGESGDAQGALAALEEALRLDPSQARAWNNLGNAQRTLGRLEDAEASFTRALALRPDYALAASNLGEVQRDRGELERAEATLRAALARQPGTPFRPIVVLLAGLLRVRGALDEAAELYRKAIDLSPQESGGQWFNLGWILTERNEPAQAREAYARAQDVDPGDLRSLFGARLTLPMIYTDAAEIASARASFTAGLTALERDLPAALKELPEARVLDALRWSNFFLAYQGEEDRALQVAYAALAGRVIDAGAPQWHAPLATRSNRRTRIGFASAFFHVGTCGRYFKSWITDLDRDRFEVFVYHLSPGMDEVARSIADRADCFRTFGGSRARPSIVAPAMRDDALDVLVYPELGMDACSFALAALRLAPRQYAGWGHPVTTGHATIDAFISPEAMEPEGAEAHYIEPLVMLPGIGTRYERPLVPPDASREPFALPAHRTLLLCPQSLWKIHPENDALFAELFVANPDALLVLFAGRHPAITAAFTRRLGAVFERHGLAFGERARVLPQVGHEDYLRINLVCDAMLDTLHWSGGNTSLDALACGLPIVTLPGPYMRGRQSAGMLKLLGVSELIAGDRSEYLAIAARLAGDPVWRDDLRTRIRAAHGWLFDVSDAIEPLQRLFQFGAPAVQMRCMASSKSRA